MEKVSRVMWGIVLVVLGVIIGANAMDIIDVNIFFDGWWTLFIIVPCFISLFDNVNESKVGNLIGLAIGVLLLLAAQGLFSFSIIAKLIIPFILVIIGISMIFGSALRTKINEKIKAANTNDLENIVATFSEQVVNVDDTEKFKGANLDAVFGSVVLDLSKAHVEKESVIKASAIFGGIDIIVPKDTVVKVKSLPIFGGVSNVTRKEKDAKNIIYVDGFALFGGIEIK